MLTSFWCGVATLKLQELVRTHVQQSSRPEQVCFACCLSLSPCVSQCSVREPTWIGLLHPLQTPRNASRSLERTPRCRESRFRATCPGSSRRRNEHRRRRPAGVDGVNASGLRGPLGSRQDPAEQRCRHDLRRRRRLHYSALLRSDGAHGRGPRARVGGVGPGSQNQQRSTRRRRRATRGRCRR